MMRRQGTLRLRDQPRGSVSDVHCRGYARSARSPDKRIVRPCIDGARSSCAMLCSPDSSARCRMERGGCILHRQCGGCRRRRGVGRPFGREEKTKGATNLCAALLCSGRSPIVAVHVALKSDTSRPSLYPLHLRHHHSCRNYPHHHCNHCQGSSPTSAIRALKLPEIVFRLALYLDMQDLLACSAISHRVKVFSLFVRTICMA